MTKPFRPTLASPAGLTQIKFPCYVSAKLDGIRCVVHEGEPKTRTLEDVPNLFIRSLLSNSVFEGMDGELVTYTDGVLDDFNTIQSKVMRRDGQPEFMFVVFDIAKAELGPYTERATVLRNMVNYAEANGCDFLTLLDQYLINDLGQLAYYEGLFVGDGYEGIMIRDPQSPYKHGRSTVKEGYLLKYKRFFDTEAKVIGFVEKERNTNALERSNTGAAKRSSAKAGKVPANTLGALVMRLPNGIEFEIGTGFTEAQRKEIWDTRDSKLGEEVTFRYQELSPAGKPRFPSFVGFRYDLKGSK